MITMNGDEAPKTVRSPQVEALHDAHRAAQDAKREARRRRDREALNARIGLQAAYATGRLRF